GGATWTNQVLVGQGGTIPLPSPNSLCEFDSALYGPDGTLYYAFTGVASLPAPATGSNHGHSTIYLLVSHNGGATFAPPVAIDTNPLNPAYQGGDVIPSMATDPNTGQLYVAWEEQDFTTQKLFGAVLATSTTEGQSFAAPVGLDVGTNAGGGFPNPSVGPDGTVYVAFPDFQFAPGPELFDVTVSTNHGQVFSTPVTVFTGNGCGSPPPGGDCSSQLKMNDDADISTQIAASPVPGTVYATGQTLLGNQFRMVFSVSHNSGATWTTPTVVGIPAGLSTDSQFFPNMSVAPNGRIDIVYYDENWMAGFENTYAISSSDGGNTWSTPELLGSAASSSNPTAFFNNEFGGGRLIADSNSAIFATWTDSRRGTVATAKTDVFSATVREPGEAGYVVAASNGAVTGLGDAAKLASAGSISLAVGVAATPDGGGYWLATSSGAVFTSGDASSFGSLAGTHLNAPIVGIAATPDGGGYWLVASDGGVFTLGDAPFFGALGQPGAGVVGIAPTPDAGGYWLVSSRGLVSAFGDATSFGSATSPASKVVGIAATADGGGYLLAEANGTVLACGDAVSLGSASFAASAPAAAIAITP
ncbi:MAG: sialidase family protein, partial [Candidatus Dormibacteria bacterium]